MSRSAASFKLRQPFALRATGPLIAVLVLFYLGFHALSGERGVVALFKETRRLEAVTAELAAIKLQREMLDHKVRLLSSGSLDLDLLDEQVRRELGMANKNEIVYFLQDAPANP